MDSPRTLRFAPNGLRTHTKITSRRVMAKVGMTLVRRFRLTPEDLANADTFHTDSAEVWDGDDVEYALERTDWEKQRH